MPIASIDQSTRLLRLQVGTETTWGTAVAATSIVHGAAPVPKVTPQVKVTQFDEQLGTLTPSFRSAQLALGGTWEHSGNALFEDILYVLGGAFGVPTPAGGVWTFVPPVAATFAPLSQTMELGNVQTTDCIKAAGCLLDTWSIKGEHSKELTYDAKGFYKTTTFGTLTGSLNLRTVETILTPSVALCMEAAGGTPGTTPFTATLVTFEVSGVTGLKPVYSGGALAPTSFVYNKQECGLKVGLLYNSTLATYLGTNPVAGLPMVLDLKATSGSKYLDIQYSGVLKSDPVYWGDNQGAQLVELDLGPQYDTSLANYAKFIVKNALSSLP